MLPIKANDTKMKDCTILLQGRINEECFNLWIKNHKDSNVVVSIWEDEDLTKFDIPKKWKVVVNQYPIFRSWKYANLDYQIITTFYGLNRIKTKYTIKLRCDEYWSNLYKIYKLIKKNEEKIVSSSMYFRSKEYDNGKHKFHIGDKILGGTTENLILMFESTIHNLDIKLWDTHNPEGQLGLGYILAKEKNFDIDNFLTQEVFVRSHDTTKDEVTKTLMQGLYTINKMAMQVAVKNMSKQKIDWKDAESDVGHIWDIANEIINKIKDYTQVKSKFNDLKYLKKWFHIIDINELKPYIATYSGGSSNKTRIWFRDNFDHEKEKCLTDINQ
jgi:hypothetical protein